MKVYEYKFEFGNFRNQFFTVEELTYMMREKLEANPISKKSFVSHWNIEKKSRFIESLILNLPISAFYFDGSLEPWMIIDGEKRLNTIRQFVEGKFALQSLYFLADSYENYYFNDLPLLVKRKMLNYKSQVYILNPGTSPLVKYGIYTSLLSKSAVNASWRCRSFLFEEGFLYIQDLSKEFDGRQGRARALSATAMFRRQYVIEDLVGHLLVYCLYQAGYYNEYELDINIEVLLNSLLMDGSELPRKAESVSFGSILHHVFAMINWIELQNIKEVHKVDALLAVLAFSGIRGSKLYTTESLIKLIDKEWKKLGQPDGYRLKDYLQRCKNVSDLFKRRKL